MENQALVQEACEKHLRFVKGFYKMIENFLTHSQSRILLWIWMQEQPRAVDITEHFGLTAGRVSNILKALEEKGYIIRKKSENDRRNAYIELTEAGEKEAQDTYQQVQNMYQAFFEKIGPEDARAFLDMENKLMSLFEEA